MRNPIDGTSGVPVVSRTPPLGWVGFVLAVLAGVPWALCLMGHLATIRQYPLLAWISYLLPFVALVFNGYVYAKLFRGPVKPGGEMLTVIGLVISAFCVLTVLWMLVQGYPPW